MARIRTVKPEFFRHHGLFQLEKETQLPIRVAFAGLFTAADREGRFRWRPEELKLDCLPFDPVDFPRVLDALTTRGFIRKYTVAGEEFGVIPSFKRHQVINNRESASMLPEPSLFGEIPEPDANPPRVPDASPTRHGLAQGEGKGKEGNKDLPAPPRERPRNPIFDAIVEVFGFKPPHPPREGTRLGRVAADLKTKGATPEAIRERFAAARREWGGKPFGPEALVKHWDQLASASRNGHHQRGGLSDRVLT